MGRVGFGCLLIILAMVALIGIIVIPVIPDLDAPTNASIDAYLGTLLCNKNETIVRDQYQTRDSDGTSYSMNVFCQAAEGDPKDVTPKWVLYGIGGFLVPFLIGLLLFIVGMAARARRSISNLTGGVINPVGMSGVSFGGGLGTLSGSSRQPQVFASRTSQWDGSGRTPAGMPAAVEYSDGVLRVGGMEINMGALTPEQVEALRRQGQEFIQAAKAGGVVEDKTNLVARLKELQEARDSGLITSLEYDRMRQEILDNWSSQKP